jgi:hypothetical protein
MRGLPVWWHCPNFSPLATAWPAGKTAWPAGRSTQRIKILPLVANSGSECCIIFSRSYSSRAVGECRMKFVTRTVKTSGNELVLTGELSRHGEIFQTMRIKLCKRIGLSWNLQAWGLIASTPYHSLIMPSWSNYWLVHMTVPIGMVVDNDKDIGGQRNHLHFYRGR